jgi:hypothetical protein
MKTKLIEYGTKNPADRAYQQCRCDNCGIEALCTPAFDFYGSEGEPLKCERCSRESWRDQDIETVTVKRGSHKEFDRHFNQVFEQVRQTQKAAAVIIVGWIVVSLTVLTLVTWAAIHFIAKFW